MQLRYICKKICLKIFEFVLNMEVRSFHQGGCDITWRIEKCNLYTNIYKSPTFYLSQSHKTEWYLEISYKNSCYFCHLKPVETLVKTTLYFDVCISSDEESEESSGLVTFSDEEHLQLAHLPLQEKLPYGSLIIHARLKDISEPGFCLQLLSFHSVVEVESRKVQYDIPFYNVWASNVDVDIRVIPAFPNSIPFEMKIGGYYEQSTTDIDKYLQIDISQSSNIERFGFFCKVTCEDSQGKSIGSSTRFHVFEKESSSVCSLKFSFDKPTQQSFFSINYVLVLKCEFSTTEGKSVSWIENSTTIPHPDENINNEISEKEKDSLMEEFFCLYIEGKNTDVVISAQGRKFHAHKMVLRERSLVFTAMFDTDMVEKESNIVKIADAEAETLDQMLYFMYSKNLKSEEYIQILKLYEAADKYQVLTLKEKCLIVLIRYLKTQNAIELLMLANMHNDAKLQTAVESFICFNARTIFHSEEWKTLMECEPSLGCKVMHKFCMTNM